MARFWRRLGVLTAASVIGLAPGIRGSMGQGPDDAAWREAQSVGTPEAFQGYLDQFPLGRYADQAFASIVLQARGIGTGDTPAAPARAVGQDTPAAPARGAGQDTPAAPARGAGQGTAAPITVGQPVY